MPVSFMQPGKVQKEAFKVRCFWSPVDLTKHPSYSWASGLDFENSHHWFNSAHFEVNGHAC